MTVREPTLDDAEALADLLNAQSLALHGTADLSADAMRSWFGLPDLEMLVAEEGAELVAYADFAPADDADWAWIDLRQRPGRPRAGEPLLERFERRAAESGRMATRTVVAERDGATRELAESRGYAPIRYSFRMRVALSDDLPEPTFPDGVELRVMRPGEERAVWAAANDAFSDHWDFRPSPFDSWRRWNLDRDGSRPDLWWLATDGDAIAGVCLNRFSDDGDPRHGYVHILGVRKAWRRRGLGEALLRHSFRDFRGRGCDDVTLDVDGENTTGAVRLYERVGMHVERRSDTYERRRA